MRYTIVLMLAFSACAGAPPTLSDGQKLQVRNAQVQLALLDAKKAHLEAEYRQTAEALGKAASELDAIVTKVTPKGYVLGMDLKLVPEKKK